MESLLCGLALVLFVQEANAAHHYQDQFQTEEWKQENSTGSTGGADILYNLADILNITLSNFNETATNYDGSEEAFESAGGDYDFSYDYYDSFGICIGNPNVLIASDVVQILSPKSLPSSQENEWRHWTIAPKHWGGAVTVAKKDDVISQSIFQGGCEDLHFFQSEPNRTISTTEWCHEKRLLSCDATMQISYHMLGYSPAADPGKAIDIVQLSNDVSFDYKENEREFSLYYYECGGERHKGDIRSPMFPDEAIPYRGSVTCKWNLNVGQSWDYGILRITGFNLPFCQNHHLLIEEDTVIDEKDVTDSLLTMLKQQEHHENVTELNSGDSKAGELSSYGINKPFNATKLQELYNESANVGKDENIYFYRDNKVSKIDAKKNPRLGIHVVVIRKYCGNYHLKRTFTWRRGSKNVTLTFISENFSLRDIGFTAKFSTFSWLQTVKQHSRYNFKKYRRKSAVVSHVIFNYIILIVFVPIGLTIGLSVIIFHIKKRGPTLRDFYRRERKEMKFRRTQTERVKSSFPIVHRPVRRTHSLNASRPIQNYSEIADANQSNPHQGRRRSSLLSVKYFITKKKPAFPLRTLTEEDNITPSAGTNTSMVKKKSGTGGVS